MGLRVGPVLAAMISVQIRMHNNKWVGVGIAEEKRERLADKSLEVNPSAKQ
jgi:hypothetical protein